MVRSVITNIATGKSKCSLSDISAAAVLLSSRGGALVAGAGTGAKAAKIFEASFDIANVSAVAVPGYARSHGRIGQLGHATIISRLTAVATAENPGARRRYPVAPAITRGLTNRSRRPARP
jgi:hypothetical protein